MEPDEKNQPEALHIRPVLEEFKTFVQHKIEVLERFKNVEELRIYLDALELGVETIGDIQMEDREEAQRAEVEFEGTSTEEPSEDGGVETEDLEPVDEEWAMPKEGEVLAGEREDGKPDLDMEEGEPDGVLATEFARRKEEAESEAEERAGQETEEAVEGDESGRACEEPEGDDTGVTYLGGEEP